MKAILLFIFLIIIWLLLTLNVTVPNIIVGVVATLLVTIFYAKYSLESDRKLLQIGRYFWAFIYLFIFLWECIKANIDVMYRVVHPAMPIKPGIVRVKSSLKTDIGKVFLANSITMTPGTITVDIIDDNFYIHWIYVYSKDPAIYTQKIMGRFEKYIKRIFE
ncbi:MAG: Na+/H+ antiporter subunit E [Spirochaetota bacterium]